MSIKPTPAPSSAAMEEIRKTHERMPFINDLIRYLRPVIEKTARHCVNCGHWQPKQELCMLHKARPPAAVIVIGCKDHVELDEIPF